ncbi:molybdate ABC transporter substrate-binding protein [Bacillus songklensis]|uniref:Molybdate ABC transporter substrate-binding protein n=1 Tax=Bacillus songklensis TaxID=1069116 RepID=A0ABV8B7T7_9BACI
MKKSCLLFLMLMLSVGITAGCSANEKLEGQEASDKKVELIVSAAASLQDALNEIKIGFEKENPHIKIVYNYGASGALQQQISQGAPVDLFFSAAEDEFDQLVQEGLIEKGKGTDLVGNELVLVVPKDSDKRIESFEDITQARKLSIGTPETVPAGKYAKETLEHLNVWKDVEEKIVYAKDVRQVLTYVETRNVDAGIVYKTDAMISSKVKMVATAEDKKHTPIIYPLGVIKNSKHPEEAQAFYEYLQTQGSLDALEKHGFKALDEK